MAARVPAIMLTIQVERKKKQERAMTLNCTENIKEPFQMLERTHLGLTSHWELTHTKAEKHIYFWRQCAHLKTVSL